MTAQISDTVVYQDRPFNLAGVNGSGLFDPADHDLRTQRISTACWRGFYCKYGVADGVLRLIQLFVGLNDEDRAAADRGEGPLLFDRKPICYVVHGHQWSLEEGDEYSWESDDYRYDALNEIIHFSGGLLLADGFIREMYVHMGFHPAYKYREVHELIFQDGRLVRAADRSHEMAEFCEAIKNRPLASTDIDNRGEIENWIDRAFSRDDKW